VDERRACELGWNCFRGQYNNFILPKNPISIWGRGRGSEGPLGLSILDNLYTLDAAEFPQLLSRSIHGNLRQEPAATFTKLVQDVKRAPRSRNEFPGVTAYQSPELEKTSRELNDAQMAVLGRVDNDLVGAAKLQ
jgi:hypothetical protein